MSTIFIASSELTVTGLDQSHTYNEGDSRIDLNPITFSSPGYAPKIITLDFTAEVDEDTGANDFITLRSDNELVTIEERTSRKWRISSSNAADVSATIASLYFEILNTDLGIDFGVAVVINNQLVGDDGRLLFTATSVVDAVNITQTNTINEDTVGWEFNDGIGVPAIDDQLGPDSGRTYRVTFSPAPGSEGKYLIYHDTSEIDAIYSDTVVLEGSQESINERMLADRQDIQFHIDTLADAIDPFTITYTQEVISGASGAPYVQETGEFVFNITPHDEFMAFTGPFTYDEDAPLIFTPGQVTDLRGDVGFLDIQYEINLTLSDPAAGTFSTGNQITGTKTDVNAALTDISFMPSPSYKSDFTITYQQTQLSNGIDQGSAIIDIQFSGVNDVDFTTNGPFTYDEDAPLILTLGQVTDLRGDSIPTTQYEINLTLSDPAAGTFSFGTRITGTKNEVNAMLSNSRFDPSPDYNDSFTITYQQNDTTNGIDQGSAVIDMNIGNIDANDGFRVDVTEPYDWTQNTNTNLFNYATITDSRADNYPDIGYIVFCTLNAPATDANGEMRTFGTGGSSSWDAGGAELVISGTKEEVQSHLDTLEWWSRGPIDAFTFGSSLWRGTLANPQEKLLTFLPQVEMNTGAIVSSPANTNIDRVYDEDTKTNFNDDSKT